MFRMMYSAIIVSLLCTVPTCWAVIRPNQQQCMTTENPRPSFHLGGYNVDAANYNYNGLEMINELWRNNVVTMQSATKFHPNNPDDITIELNDDDAFTYPISANGQFRGIGVRGPIGIDDSEEISQDEAIYIELGFSTQELYFGLRNFSYTNTGVPETAYFLIFNDDYVLQEWEFVRANEGNATNGHQKEYHIISQNGPFDAFAFISACNGNTYDYFGRVRNNDFFLEYVDICTDLEFTSDPTLTPIFTPAAAANIGDDPHIITWPDLSPDQNLEFAQLQNFLTLPTLTSNVGNGAIADLGGNPPIVVGLDPTSVQNPEFAQVESLVIDPNLTPTYAETENLPSVDQALTSTFTEIENLPSIDPNLTPTFTEIDNNLSVEDLTLTSALTTTAEIGGDPHIITLSGMKFDFHGVCDLVLVQNPDFQEGLGMDIHVRTKKLKQYSYVSSAVLKIDDDTLEVMGDINENLFWINKQPNSNMDSDIIGLISGYPISYQKVNLHSHKFAVIIGDQKSIVMKTFKTFVRVSIHGATKEDFGNSRGLLGSFGSDKMIARNNSTVIENTNSFGQEWQVLRRDGMLFHDVEGPQAPEKCKIPQASGIRRRLLKSNTSEKEAETVCASVSPNDFDMCVFDVMATGDKEVVGAYGQETD